MSRPTPLLMTAAMAALALTAWLSEGLCRAASKEECLEAHGRGQDLREKGQLAEARRTFLACAQASCPAIVQEDCARYGQEIEQLVPSVSFAARDSRSADLPDTAVYVDGALTAERLDDGKSYELDPGKHAIRFVHRARVVTLNVVVSEGERGRALVATFDSPSPAAEPATPAATPAQPRSSRSGLPLVVAGVGAAAMATGAVLVAVGLHEVPPSCSISSHDCTVPPGDPSLSDAHRGMSLANLGVGVGIGGAAVLSGGLLWYLLEPRHVVEQTTGVAVTPWMGAGSGGVSVSTRF